MNKNDTGLSGLLKLAGHPTSGPGVNLSSFTQSLTKTSSTNLSTGLTSVDKANGLKTLSETTGPKLQSIQFGKPGSNATSSSSSGSVWGSLLSSAVSGGVSNALGGGFGGLAGLGGLISGIASLFGGSSSTTPAPLQLFSLPNSIQANLVIGSTSNGGMSSGVAVGGPSKSAIYASGATQEASRSLTQSIYSSAGAAKVVSQAAVPMDSSAIAAAVKNALLNSSSLGDVIAEI